MKKPTKKIIKNTTNSKVNKLKPLEDYDFPLITEMIHLHARLILELDVIIGNENDEVKEIILKKNKEKTREFIETLLNSMLPTGNKVILAVFGSNEIT